MEAKGGEGDSARVEGFLKSLDATPVRAPREIRARRLPKCRNCAKRFDPTPSKGFVRCKECRDTAAAARKAAAAARVEAEAEAAAIARARRMEEAADFWNGRTPGALSPEELMALGALGCRVRASTGQWGWNETEVRKLLAEISELEALMIAEHLERPDFVRAGAVFHGLQAARLIDGSREALEELAVAFNAIHVDMR